VTLLLSEPQSSTADQINWYNVKWARFKARYPADTCNEIHACTYLCTQA